MGREEDLLPGGSCGGLRGCHLGLLGGYTHLPLVQVHRHLLCCSHVWSCWLCCACHFSLNHCRTDRTQHGICSLCLWGNELHGQVVQCVSGTSGTFCFMLQAAQLY